MLIRILAAAALAAMIGVLVSNRFEDASRSSEVVLEGRVSASSASKNFGPLPAPVKPPNLVRLNAAQQLGKDIFFDHTLSNPTGYACATCHVPESGYTGPSSVVNEFNGPVPGVIPGRHGRRKPQAVPYAAFSPFGPSFDDDLQVWLGGNFWDGRATDTATQARMPFLDANEMANSPVGPFPPHAGGYAPLVAEKLKTRPYSPLFLEVFGADVFETSSDADIYGLATMAIAAFEASAEVSQFHSKYDYSEYGVPSKSMYQLTQSEENGRVLFFGNAQCSQCHSSATLEQVLATTGGRDVFTMYCYANIGVPKNPNNPFYGNTDCDTNPNGCNPAGANYIDYGLGGNPNPSPSGTQFMSSQPGDISQFRGLFKAPSVRNVDLRPSSSFVKSYMHNGVFKSLEQVVHFYNKRNIAVNQAGQEVAFDLRVGPPLGFVPLFAPPEVLDNVQNVAGVSPADATGDVESNGQVGNLGLSAAQEADVVSFLKILSDRDCDLDESHANVQTVSPAGSSSDRSRGPVPAESQRTGSRAGRSDQPTGPPPRERKPHSSARASRPTGSRPAHGDAKSSPAPAPAKPKAPDAREHGRHHPDK